MSVPLPKGFRPEDNAEIRCIYPVDEGAQFQYREAGAAVEIWTERPFLARLFMITKTKKLQESGKSYED